jgi:uncharacterized protein YPO0396
LTPHQVSGLDERFAKQSDAVRLDNLDKVTTSVERALNAEIEEVNRGIGACEKEIEARFADFKRQWPMDAGDMDTSLASAPDFFAKLVDWKRMACLPMSSGSSNCCRTKATRIWQHFPPT